MKVSLTGIKYKWATEAIIPWTIIILRDEASYKVSASLAKSTYPRKSSPNFSPRHPVKLRAHSQRDKVSESSKLINTDYLSLSLWAPPPRRERRRKDRDLDGGREGRKKNSARPPRDVRITDLPHVREGKESARFFIRGALHRRLLLYFFFFLFRYEPGRCAGVRNARTGMGISEDELCADVEGFGKSFGRIARGITRCFVEWKLWYERF